MGLPTRLQARLRIASHFRRASSPIRHFRRVSSPIRHFRRVGRPILQFRRVGRPILHFRRVGRPILQIKRVGRPVLQFRRVGRPILQFKQLSRPVLLEIHDRPCPCGSLATRAKLTVAENFRFTESTKTALSTKRLPDIEWSLDFKRNSHDE